MDGVSAAAAVLAVATAGAQISIRLYSLSTQISGASDTITFLANDVAMISGVLKELGQLVESSRTDGNQRTFSHPGLDLINQSIQSCSKAFDDLSLTLDKASSQLARMSKSPKEVKIKLRPLEKAKWPFLQPGIQGLRTDLRDAKSTLMLVLQLGTLRTSKIECEMSAQASSKDILGMESMKRTVESIWQEHIGHTFLPGENSGLPDGDVRGRGTEHGAHEHNSSSGDGVEKPEFLESRSDKVLETFAKTKRSDPVDYDQVEAISFQLKPVAKEVQDRVELSWRGQMSRLPPNHLHNFFQQEAVTHETLGGLDQHEQDAITRGMEKFGQHARIVSAKKISSNLVIRDNVVKDVPGVQVLILNKLGEFSEIDRYPPARDFSSRYAYSQPPSYRRDEAADENIRMRGYLESGRKESRSVRDYYTLRASNYGQGPNIGRYPEEDPSYSPSPMKYVLSATERRGGDTDSSHRGKRRRKDNENSSHNGRPTPSRSQSSRTSSTAEDSRRQTAGKQDQRREEQLPKPFKERPDGTGSGVVDYLLNKYTTYFES